MLEATLEVELALETEDVDDVLLMLDAELAPEETLLAEDAEDRLLAEETEEFELELEAGAMLYATQCTAAAGLTNAIS